VGALEWEALGTVDDGPGAADVEDGTGGCSNEIG
jgi:hypothetical protein